MKEKCSLRLRFPGSPSAFFLTPASLLHIGRCLDEHVKKVQLPARCLCARVDGPATAQKRSITQIVNFHDFSIFGTLRTRTTTAPEGAGCARNRPRHQHSMGEKKFFCQLFSRFIAKTPGGATCRLPLLEPHGLFILADSGSQAHLDIISEEKVIP